MTDKLDIDHLKQWIGRTDEASDVVTAQLVKGLRATLFLDIGTPKPATPRRSRRSGAWRSRWPRWTSSAPMVTPRAADFSRQCRCRAACGRAAKCSSSIRLLVGDEVTRSSKILDVNLKTGSTGALCFVNVEHLITTKRGLAIRERQDIVYRDMPTSMAPPAPRRRKSLRPSIRKRITPIPCCCFATRR
jgi:3-methylfumaryl-CoA hydratase